MYIDPERDFPEERDVFIVYTLAITGICTLH
jgi:hypothetical protein